MWSSNRHGNRSTGSADSANLLNAFELKFLPVNVVVTGSTSAHAPVSERYVREKLLSFFIRSPLERRIDAMFGIGRNQEVCADIDAGT